MDTLEGMAATLANNHAKFDSFGWFERPDDSHLWTIYYTHNRDSKAIDRANAEVIAGLFEPFVEAGDMRPEDHGHWACGWIKGYSIRVYTSGGAITDAFKALYDVLQRLDDYPCLDEEKWSELENTEAYEAGCVFCYGPADRHKNYMSVDLGDGSAYAHATCARLASMRGDRNGKRAWREIKSSMQLSA